MSKIYNIVHSQSVEGREKPIHNVVGILLVKDDGKKSIKLNSIPVSKEWDGWLNVYEKREKEDSDF